MKHPFSFILKIGKFVSVGSPGIRPAIDTIELSESSSIQAQGVRALNLREQLRWQGFPKREDG
jgi:hypothetical protein